MASNSGTLFQYFKNKEQPKAIVNADNNAPKRRKNAANSPENQGKRRKLCLARLREKQKLDTTMNSALPISSSDEASKGKENIPNENIEPPRVMNYEKVMIEQVKKTLNFAEADDLDKIMCNPRLHKSYVLSDSDENDDLGLDDSSSAVEDLDSSPSSKRESPKKFHATVPEGIVVDKITTARRSGRVKKPVERYVIENGLGFYFIF